MPVPEATVLCNNFNYHQHVHDHSGKTSCELGHAHMHPGVTGLPRPVNNSHDHILQGITTFDHGHTHSYYTITGPAIDLPGGMHTHYVYFETNEVDGHRHRVQGFVVPAAMG
ncbi:hypothetical protein MTHERMOG20_09950 [Moorella thermoacetica]|uniref:YmaF family protein n=3 Tax=Neomoorella thermoacetica TaxID=1525 RepID=A0A1D7XCC3_NEOTH|nr:YmaF family protein [Moorella thermoacetica]AKX94625.1 YmaF family protein [Moorella thermoacetica]AKX97261.1 YmaF family protein [Moorella thermoacetica]AOQ24549.1 YmaF family protein [Moorella thermoacetica]OIQ11810.1 YmaF family protein [Moorella thermoacetica]OIQ57320.1 YmaF family protein [Moorella thermoacetica]